MCYLFSQQVWGNSYILKKGLKLFLFGILTIILPTGELELRPGWGSCGALRPGGTGTPCGAGIRWVLAWNSSGREPFLKAQLPNPDLFTLWPRWLFLPFTAVDFIHLFLFLYLLSNSSSNQMSFYHSIFVMLLLPTDMYSKLISCFLDWKQSHLDVF